MRREANRTLKDARDLATRAVMHAPTWVRSLSIHFPDSVSTWWYQVRAYGLNYWFGGTNLCPFCRAAGEVDRARLAIRPTHFGICHHSVLRASHLKVHNAVVALIGAEIRLGDLSDAFLRSTVRPVTPTSAAITADTVGPEAPHWLTARPPPRPATSRWAPYPIAPLAWCETGEAHHDCDLLCDIVSSISSPKEKSM